MSGRWKIVGYDTFSSEWYALCPDYGTEREARTAALKKLEELERLQPTKDSGGQSDSGIQDRVFVERPDGTRYRAAPE